MCLPGGNEKWSLDSTSLYIRVSPGSVWETGKSLRITLHKQKLPNGFQIPAGVEMYIPGRRISDIGGNRKMDIPNWKLNEYIRMVNLEKLRNTKDNQ